MWSVQGPSPLWSSRANTENSKTKSSHIRSFSWWTKTSNWSLWELHVFSDYTTHSIHWSVFACQPDKKLVLRSEIKHFKSQRIPHIHYNSWLDSPLAGKSLHISLSEETFKKHPHWYLELILQPPSATSSKKTYPFFIRSEMESGIKVWD